MTIDEKNIDPIQEMIRIVNDFSKIYAWNFKESFRSKNGKELIFNSEWCRVNLVWGDGTRLEVIRSAFIMAGFMRLMKLLQCFGKVRIAMHGTILLPHYIF